MQQKDLLKTAPIVSVIIATHGNSPFLEDAVKSVLQQDFKDFELIISDDSTDTAVEELTGKFAGPIKFIRTHRDSFLPEKQSAIEHSSGKYIAFLDDDDQWHQNKLSAQVGFLEANPEYGFVSSGAEMIDENGVVRKELKKGIFNQETFESLYVENFVHFSSVMVRRCALLASGGFDKNMGICENTELCIRLARYNKFKFIPRELISYRQTRHEMNLSRLDKKVRDTKKLWKKLESIGDFSWYQKRMARARKYNLSAKQYYESGYFLRAAFCLAKSVYYIPFIGFFFWPKEVSNMRFSFFYRVLKPYFSIVRFLFKASFTKNCHV